MPNYEWHLFVNLLCCVFCCILGRYCIPGLAAVMCCWAMAWRKKSIKFVICGNVENLQQRKTWSPNYCNFEFITWYCCGGMNLCCVVICILGCGLLIMSIGARTTPICCTGFPPCMLFHWPPIIPLGPIWLGLNCGGICPAVAWGMICPEASGVRGGMKPDDCSPAIDGLPMSPKYRGRFIVGDVEIC